MLDFRQLIDQVAALADEVERRSQENAAQMQTALETATGADTDFEAFRARVEDARTTWLAAVPLDETPITRGVSPPTIPARYTAIATDGSQIPLDRHSAASYYVLNVGEIALHYGSGERPLLQSTASLSYKESDLLVGGDTGEATYINEQILATRRMLAECEASARLIEAYRDRSEPVALVDGTLILWAQEAQRDADRQEAVSGFMRLLNAARECGVPIAGYLSRPGSREVVNALRTRLCPGEQVRCRPCPHTPRPCEIINRVNDAALYHRILPTGQRSGLFESRSKILDSYTPPQNRVAFFYVNVGSEIARVEIPIWVAKSKDLTARVHALVYDQAVKGRGYPTALLEAHEMAVVHGADREAFNRVVENALIRRRLPVHFSRKAVAKRVRTL